LSSDASLRCPVDLSSTSRACRQGDLFPVPPQGGNGGGMQPQRTEESARWFVEGNNT
jgi:hypothetical protein